jgi:hypothetical protein
MCGAQITLDSNEPEKILMTGQNPAVKPGFSFMRIFSGIFGVLFFLFILDGVITYKSLGHRRVEAREKACYANMRVILGAVEMYNMDNVDMISTLHDRDATSEDGALIQGKYLRNPISRPETGCYYRGFNLDGTGRVECNLHGTVEGNY